MTHNAGPRRRTPGYHAWANMVQRCTNPLATHYAAYGGRGIGICDRWRQSFEAFIADVGPRPSAAHSIDRIDTNGHYEPGNVRWATATQQQRNTRRNHLIEAFGQTKPLVEWAELTGLCYVTIVNRIRAGWSPERALTKRSQRRGAAEPKPALGGIAA